MKSSASLLHSRCYLSVTWSDNCISKFILLVVDEVVPRSLLGVLILGALSVRVIIWSFDQQPSKVTILSLLKE